MRAQLSQRATALRPLVVPANNAFLVYHCASRGPPPCRTLTTLKSGGRSSWASSATTACSPSATTTDERGTAVHRTRHPGETHAVGVRRVTLWTWCAPSPRMAIFYKGEEFTVYRSHVIHLNETAEYLANGRDKVSLWLVPVLDCATARWFRPVRHVPCRTLAVEPSPDRGNRPRTDAVAVRRLRHPVRHLCGYDPLPWYPTTLTRPQGAVGCCRRR